MKTLTHTLEPEFHFAGFSFPKHVFTLPRGPLKKRAAAARNPCCGPYYHTPPVNNRDGIGFYLDSDGMPGLRWQWCDDVCESICHTGWYSDEFGDGEKIRGIVMQLPRGRGWLAGWSMGESMASSIDYDVYETARGAAIAADSMAERAAENQREYEEKERERLDEEERRLTTTLPED